MPIEAVKIPQNVYVEDRIIGPVTLRQLIITGIGGGIGYTFYALAAQAGLTSIPVIVICWSPTVVAAMFAFFKINDLTLFNIILLTIESVNKPRERFWSPHPGLTINLITRQSMKEIEASESKAQSNTEKLIDLTRQLEKRQEEMNKLSNHSMPRPEATESVAVQLKDGTKHGLYEHAESDAEIVSPGEQSERNSEGFRRPVHPGRVTIGGLSPMRSIDGIVSDLRVYERFTTDSF